MAKTAIGEFCTLLRVCFSDITADSQFEEDEAVATPMAQKDAEGCWEGAARLLRKSLLNMWWSCKSDAAFWRFIIIIKYYFGL